MKIVLATLNARHIHSAFGLRYLLANLGSLRANAHLREFTIARAPLEIVEALLADQPDLLGLSVYIWNATPTLAVVRQLKALRPALTIVLGGPEVSHETDEQELCQLADYVICGEGDIAFRELCDRLESGERPTSRVIRATPPRFDALELPYDEYLEEDIAHRVLYVEASRGCPFRCEFCLSSLDNGVRKVPLERFLVELERLLERGANQFKFIDRTFNLSAAHSGAILEFFLARYRPGMFLHFEMIPDRLPAELRTIIARFPDGALQFEVGIQTFDPAVAARISRRQDYAALEHNLRFLRDETGVHVHADLIVGLPGEDEASFAAGFDRLSELAPQEIQVGILKRLRGTPIARHSDEWGMIYSPDPPYEILENRLLDFATLARMRRFARVVDLIKNSGNFVEATALIAGAAGAYAGLAEFSEWLVGAAGRTHAIALHRLVELVLDFLTEVRGLEARSAAEILLRDYRRGGRPDIPAILRRLLPDAPRYLRAPDSDREALPARQARHRPTP
ncbi:MAG: DUF4080 domain-containing protein [Myxococcales bacterium]|nr:DUF4080 domain-containing protein [Myxococcales bacterium]